LGYFALVPRNSRDAMSTSRKISVVLPIAQTQRKWVVGPDLKITLVLVGGRPSKGSSEEGETTVGKAYLSREP